ncbi:MAG: ECF transporter S component [Lachnospiraceae bacterium]|nr:ECF transporter S component [Lachnospiraceae bacterium]
MKTKIKIVIWLGLITVLVLAGAFVFDDSSWSYVCIAVSALCIVPFFLSFERKNDTTKNVILAVLIALNTVGRFVFAPLPSFKPVTAITIICGMYMGPVYGFMCGSLTAVLSNFYFGQGPWTAFQMLSWGLVGFGAGLLGRRLMNSKAVLLIYGMITGCLYSLVMDIWTTMWMENTFNIERFMFYVTGALPTMVIYMVSNCIFLFVLIGPMRRKMDRIFIKYDINSDLHRSQD